MIAIIEPKNKAVWGFGTTIDLAWQHARKCIKEWKERNPKGEVAALEVASLSPEADFRQDGETLWQWVMNNRPVQGALL